MALISVAELLYDADFVDPVTVLRMVQTVNDQGVASFNRVPITILASIQSTITRLARGESAVSQVVPPPPLPRGRTAPLLEQCRLEWRRGMKADELARRVGCSTKTARRHIATLQAELDEPVPFAQPRKRA